MLIVLLVVGCFIWGIFMGMLIQKRYTHYDGKIVIDKVEGKTVFTLEFDGNLDEIENKRSISFKVVPLDDALAE